MSQLDVLALNFDEAFSAPGGIGRLRELILTLAMQGKLVPQDPAEGSADELLREIESEKKRLVAEGKIKVPKLLRSVEEAEMPYELPEGWRWVKLGEVVNSLTGGGTPDKNNSSYWGGDIPWASVKDLNVEVYLDDTIDKITRAGIENSATNLIEAGSVIVCTRMGLGKIAINRVPVAINQDLKALKISSRIDAMYFFLKYKTYEIKGSGVTVAGIKQDELLNFLFPLPPRAEQRRIVTRIDQLMTRCDELEDLRKQQEQKRVQVHRTVLREITIDNDPAAFVEGWQFLADHFGELHATPQNVTELRSAVLQLAVMGKLVPQDPAEGNAEELLREIEAEKKRLVAAGKIKAPKPLTPVSDAEQPYQVPQGWAWVRLGKLVDILNGRAYKQNELLEVDTGVPVLRVGNLFTSNKWYYSDLSLESDKYIDNGDLIYAWSASFGPFIWKGDRTIYHYHIWKLRFTIEERPIKAFLYQFLKQQTENIKRSGNGIAMLHMTKERMEMLLTPLPPLAEQRRIVAKVDSLMALCDQLEARLRERTYKQGELLGAVMAQLAPGLASGQPAVASRGRAQVLAADMAPRGRPRKAAQAGMGAAQPAGGRRGRPRKDDSGAGGVPQAASVEDAIQKLEAIKAARAARQPGLFDE